MKKEKKRKSVPGKVMELVVKDIKGPASKIFVFLGGFLSGILTIISNFVGNKFLSYVKSKDEDLALGGLVTAIVIVFVGLFLTLLLELSFPWLMLLFLLIITHLIGLLVFLGYYFMDKTQLAREELNKEKNQEMDI